MTTPKGNAGNPHETCPQFLVDQFAAKDIEVTASTQRPLVAGPYTTEGFVCPHDIAFWPEPTGKQITRWAQDEGLDQAAGNPYVPCPDKPDLVVKAAGYPDEIIEQAAKALGKLPIDEPWPGFITPEIIERHMMWATRLANAGLLADPELRTRAEKAEDQANYLDTRIRSLGGNFERLDDDHKVALWLHAEAAHQRDELEHQLDHVESRLDDLTAKREPRVWKTGDAEPIEPGLTVLDREDDTWLQVKPGTWTCSRAGGHGNGAGWKVALRCGPLTEVRAAPDAVLPTTREELAKFFGGIRLAGSGANVTGHFVQHALDLIDANGEQPLPAGSTDPADWQCGKCEGANVPGHFRLCPKRAETAEPQPRRRMPREIYREAGRPVPGE